MSIHIHRGIQAIILTVLCFLLPSRASAQGSRAADTKPHKPSTEAVKRGDLDLVIRATGTIEPEEVVNVDAAVAGTVTSFGPDPTSRDRSTVQGQGRSITIRRSRPARCWRNSTTPYTAQR